MVRQIVAAGILSLLCVPVNAQNPIVITDVLGRKVELPKPAERIVLGEGRQIIALSLLDPNPVKRIVGWLGEFRNNDPSTYALYRRKFPAVEKIPLVGASADNTFSVEQALALKPDLVVLGIGQAKPPNETVRQLEAGGIPVVVTDFFINPFDNTLPSMRILGEAIGRPERVKSFADFYRQPGRPKILFETHAGMAECCFAPGHGSISRFVEFAGGHNIGADVLPGPAGQLSAEYILAQDPPIYIATGGSHLEKRGGLVIGLGYSAAMIKERLEKLIARPAVSGIAAIRDGQVHCIFHNLITTPLNILATENLAKWAHPQLFNDLDPSRTMKELNERFLAVPLEGIYWIDLSSAKRP